MAYIKAGDDDLIGKTVKLTQIKGSLSGHFEIGSIVKITATDDRRGHTFEDDDGNRVTEAGFSGFEFV